MPKITKERKQCYLSGNFNIDLLKYDVINKHRDFLNMVTSFGYLPLFLLYPLYLIDNIYGNNLEDEII